MRKFILIFFICVCTLSVSAQTNVLEETTLLVTSDTIQVDSLKFAKSQSVLEKDLRKQLDEAKAIIEQQTKRLLELQDVETKLTLSQNKNVTLIEQLDVVSKQAEKAEKNLISLASNFLYVPYEAYGVEEVAIKAFESIQNTKLKQEYHQRYVLLKNYKQHLMDLKLYLQKVQKACNGVFQATATEFIDGDDLSVSSDMVLKKQPFYLEYVKYDGYEDTFIGGLIQKTEEILRTHTKQERANMKEILDTINQIQTPVKIDTLDKVIETKDERLKTLEDL